LELASGVRVGMGDCWTGFVLSSDDRSLDALVDSSCIVATD
jgi:hypothetical protein